DGARLDAARRRRGRTGVRPAGPRVDARHRHLRARLPRDPGRAGDLDARGSRDRLRRRHRAAHHRPAPAREALGGARMTRRTATLGVGIALTALIALIALVSLVWLPHGVSDTSGG